LFKILGVPVNTTLEHESGEGVGGRPKFLRRKKRIHRKKFSGMGEEEKNRNEGRKVGMDIEPLNGTNLGRKNEISCKIFLKKY